MPEKIAGGSVEVNKVPAIGVEMECAVERDGMTPATDVMEMLVVIPGMNVFKSQQVSLLYQKLNIYRQCKTFKYYTNKSVSISSLAAKQCNDVAGMSQY